MLFTTDWLEEFLTPMTGRNNQYEIFEVMTDSRKNANNALFIPLIGENFDAHTYLEQAVENGAVATIWDKGKPLPEKLDPSIAVYMVEDTLMTLQQIASKYRDLVNPKVIGITGSNGKTTTKDMVASIMKTTFMTHHTQGNFNNHIGLPLTILSMKRETEVLVLEMGMSQAGEIDTLTRIARPDYALITNIGESHIEYLGSREGIAKAKLEIENGLKTNGILLLDGDEPLLSFKHKHANVVTCGFEPGNEHVITSVHISHNKTDFEVDGQSYTIPLPGKHHAKNAALALSVCGKLGVTQECIQKGFLDLEMTSMRFQLLEGKQDVAIINDAYNASATSMKAAIEVVKQMEGFKKKVLVLGDILELGDYAEELHRSVADAIEPPVDTVYTYGESANWISSELQNKGTDIELEHFTTKSALIKALQPYLNKETLILFKASRGLKFETMVEAIS
ncbi:UDP-N-acetylmuramoyl-tripeptide--D-alanyl-D-alanine ligase [Oceanobacillus jordanicus]|uniref:UDP-N-acetylmuramoyl-tripeptide--D-alanyl-D-alanine ligase n=1 Tax=Oceanobacillus jordanicus TaxID=2867266 RepID=A0AAW5B7E1_9BACI|nr:UDP-N-acetylmuramoyl-tripeptide--D-alanyl-D-alanine ligase [Oceanobacillus jordanicus]MCG3420489.1 UDP-N-acetylmuramoyl-tripeptide--D-alanyl-D-alanine ligase [Oceanobacillus jordanicus]